MDWDVGIDNADRDNNMATGTDDFWDFGTNMQYPVLKGTDVNGDTGKLSVSITIRAASILPMSLSATTLTMEGVQSSDNTIRLTSRENWIASVRPTSGSESVTEQAITVFHAQNVTAERMTTVTFTETTEGTSPPLEVVLTVTPPRPAPIVLSTTALTEGPTSTENTTVMITSSVS